MRSVPLLGVAIRFALFLAALGSEAFPAQGARDGPVTLFVHLSDLHISAEDPARLSDLLYLGRRVLPHLSPEAIVISGDLTHSKTNTWPVTGRQIEREWQEYRSAVAHLAAHAGISEEAVVDVRGNHDAFDVGFTGSPRDFFSTYSSHGSRGLGGERVHLHSIPSPKGSPDNSTVCPAAVLVGLDATPDCRLRSPINFSGVVLNSMMTTAEQRLKASERAWMAAACPTPAVIGYSHYPLSVMRYPQPLLSGTAIAVKRERLPELLMRHGAATFLNGHLHAAFGQHLHRRHVGNDGNSNGNRGAAELVELESASWKYERRFRVVTIDGGAVSFADLELSTNVANGMGHQLSKGDKRACALSSSVGFKLGLASLSVRPVDPSRLVGRWLVVLTSPSDSRYWQLQRQGSGVRAVVFALHSSSVAKEASGLQARACWGCGLPSSTRATSPAVIKCEPMQKAVVGSSGSRAAGRSGAAAAVFETPRLYSSTKEPLCLDGQSLVLQVALHEDLAADTPVVACSEERWLWPPTTSSGQDRGIHASPLQVPATWLEWAVLQVNWPLLGGWALVLLPAGLHLGCMLILPRLAFLYLRLPVEKMSPCAAGLPRTESAGRLMNGSSAAASSHPCQTALVPWMNLVDAATLFPRIWRLQVLYASWLLAGPWFVGTLLSGYPPGMLGIWGVVLNTGSYRPEDCEALGWGWAWCRQVDVIFYVLPAYVLVILPGTLWLASALCSASCALPPSPSPQNAPSAAAAVWRWAAANPLLCGAFAVLFALNCRLARFVWADMGPLAVVASPGVGWPMLLAAAACLSAVTHKPETLDGKGD